MKPETAGALPRCAKISRLQFERQGHGNYLLDDILLPTQEQLSMPQQQYALMSDLVPCQMRSARVGGMGVRSCLVDLLNRA